MDIKAHFHRHLLSTAIAPAVLTGILCLLQHNPSSLKIPVDAKLVARSEEVMSQTRFLIASLNLPAIMPYR